MGEQHIAPIVPVVLAGGSGTRLWPLSADETPKQFLDLTGPESLFRQTLRRCAGLSGFAAPLVVAGRAHAPMIDADLAGAEAQLILEPVARDTAAAITLAALAAGEPAENPLLLVMPSDHVFGRPQMLIEAVRQSASLAQAGKIVTFGITPDRPETGYGYILPGRDIALPPPARAHAIAQFIEKPDAARAAALIGRGCLWNSGIFLVSRATLLAALEAHSPQILRACRAAMAAATRRGAAIEPAAPPLHAIAPLSFDRAVMEKTGDGVVVAIDAGWSDIGSWPAVWRAAEKDRDGNAVAGNAVLHGVTNSYVRSDGAVTAVIGLDGIAVVNTGNGLLVAPLHRAPELAAIAGRLPGRK